MASKQSEAALLRQPTGRIQMRARLAVAIGTLGVLALTSCSSPGLPPKTASVETVAKAYLAAAKSKNCSTTKALTASDVFSWCSNPRLISYKVTGKSYVAPGQEGVRPQTCIPTELKSKGTDESVTFNGTHPWNFCFVKTKDGWRVWDQGQG